MGQLPDYPIQIGKVQAPQLRDETLARERLLEWLTIKVHRRVVLLVAEAGYGKTTLLADFSRRTRVRMLWFRLDRGDRDWVGFIAYLVAAVRVHVPDFGSATRGLLRETATSAPPLDTVLDTFLRELAGVPGEATAFVFDDFHLVDDSPEVRQILRELLSRAPDRMSFVFATRREPPIRLARLRAQGEVAELSTDDLRFDAAETEQLFRETYDLPVDAPMLEELNRRTEGWAASLQLVRAALNDRDPSQMRAFISSLSGAEGHLYDYLAEEVIGDLPEDLQQFLMRTSILENIDFVLGPVAAAMPATEVQTFVEQAERHGLLGRGAPGARHAVRAHPLVRDFLIARLERKIGPGGVRAIHAAIAVAAGDRDWRSAARHFLAAGDVHRARSTLARSIDKVVATGAFAAADEVMAQLPAGGLGGAAELVLRSRLAQQRTAAEESLGFAEAAVRTDPESAIALLNLVTARSLVGDIAGALEASRLLDKADRPPYSDLGRSFRLAMEASLHGHMETAVEGLHALVGLLDQRGESHFAGVAQLNLSLLKLARGDVHGSLASAQGAIDQFAHSSARGDLVSAKLLRAAALAFDGPISLAREEIEQAVALAPSGQALEIATEVGWIEAFLGEPARAWLLVKRVNETHLTNPDLREQLALVRALLRLRADDAMGARGELAHLRYGATGTASAFEARRFLAEGLVRLAERRADVLTPIHEGTAMAQRQGAWLWAAYGELLGALADLESDPSGAVLDTGKSIPAVLSMLAEPTLTRLSDLDDAAAQAVLAEAAARPWRWRDAVRSSLEQAVGPNRQLARVLAAIGEPRDVLALRSLARSQRESSIAELALSLARRLAPHVFVEDLGRIRIEIDGRRIDGTDVRRKVLALLCLLLTKTRFTSTREEVADTLWPEQDPSSALNSLNQTVYFLRRVFEPDYRDDLSPIYVGQDGETIWLDVDLVDSRSARCAALIRTMPNDAASDGVLDLAQQYLGKFALDFAYDEWAANFRDGLHATYLRVMERAIQFDLDSGHFQRGIFLAERASEADPDADEIQAALVRLYRLSGSYAAAAEQYTKYSQGMRELGLEPRPLEEV